MTTIKKNDSANVSISFTQGGDEVAGHQVGRHVIPSPRFNDWADYWEHSTRPSEDFVTAVLNRKDDELPTEGRVGFD